MYKQIIDLVVDNDPVVDSFERRDAIFYKFWINLLYKTIFAYICSYKCLNGTVF